MVRLAHGRGAGGWGEVDRMREVTHYVCGVCGTEYAQKADCERCEGNHKKPLKIKSKHYAPITADASGYPRTIEVRMSDGKIVRYKRLREVEDGGLH